MCPNCGHVNKEWSGLIRFLFFDLRKNENPKNCILKFLRISQFSFQKRSDTGKKRCVSYELLLSRQVCISNFYLFSLLNCSKEQFQLLLDKTRDLGILWLRNFCVHVRSI